MQEYTNKKDFPKRYNNYRYLDNSFQSRDGLHDRRYPIEICEAVSASIPYSGGSFMVSCSDTEAVTPTPG
jgi:hypothetical protein